MFLSLPLLSIFFTALFVASPVTGQADLASALQQLLEALQKFLESLTPTPPTTPTTPTTPSTPTTPISPSSTCSPGSTISPAAGQTDTCLKPGGDGPINEKLDTPISGGQFTFYGAGGRGACGLDTDEPKMSAAISGDLFKTNGQWVESCLPDKRSLLDDPVCKGICVKIEYNGKTLTVPANNKCPECKPDHVDLSIAAFNYLEPKGGEVGIAKDATITYLKCDGTESGGGC